MFIEGPKGILLVVITPAPIAHVEATSHVVQVEPRSWRTLGH